MDEVDSIDSGRRMMNVGKQMASLNLNAGHLNNNNNNVKLKPVVTKKTVVDGPIVTLNGHKKLPAATKVRPTTFPPEKSMSSVQSVKKVSS